MKNNIRHDKTLTGKIKTAMIVLLFLISVNTMTSVVSVQSNSSSVQNQKGSSSDPLANSVGSNKSFYLFTDEIEGINETKLRMPADYYIPNIFVANKGDRSIPKLLTLRLMFLFSIQSP
jgi:hypothetical protein